MSGVITQSNRNAVPNMLWHQTSHAIYIVLEIPDAVSNDISNSLCWNEKENEIHFKSQHLDQTVVYEFKSKLSNSIATLLKTHDNGSKFEIVLQKNNVSLEWTRLFENPIFNRCHVRINWNSWNLCEDSCESQECSEESVDSDELQELIKSGVLDNMDGLSSSDDESDNELVSPTLIHD